MIELRNLTKSYRIGQKRRLVADNISATFPSKGSVGLLGRNGAGKSTLLKLISGTTRPDFGQVISSGTVSWQIGFAGSFHPELTGVQNVRFIGRVYGVDTQSLSDFVEDFSELGDSYKMPFKTYSSGMRSRLAFGVSMGVPFSYYLIDEVTSVGDAAFRKKCHAILRQKLNESGAIIVSHSENVLRDLCRTAAILNEGRLEFFDDINEAIKTHNTMLQV